MVAISSVPADGITISESNAIAADCSFIRNLLRDADPLGTRAPIGVIALLKLVISNSSPSY
jgi:hypothetical protein